jgi:hypothetical protein
LLVHHHDRENWRQTTKQNKRRRRSESVGPLMTMTDFFATTTQRGSAHSLSTRTHARTYSGTTSHGSALDDDDVAVRHPRLTHAQARPTSRWHASQHGVPVRDDKNGASGGNPTHTKYLGASSSQSRSLKLRNADSTLHDGHRSCCLRS